MKILIVGGVAGGAGAAARARRLDEDAQIIMFEKGPFVSFSNCGLPYHISGQIEKQENFETALYTQLNQQEKICVTLSPVIGLQKRP